MEFRLWSLLLKECNLLHLRLRLLARSSHPNINGHEVLWVHYTKPGRANPKLQYEVLLAVT